MLNKDHRNRAPVHILLEAKLDWEEGQGIQLGPELASPGGQVAHYGLFKDCRHCAFCKSEGYCNARKDILLSYLSRISGFPSKLRRYLNLESVQTGLSQSSVSTILLSSPTLS